MEKSSDQQQQKQVNIEDMTPTQSIEALWGLVNKAASKGVYNIDESYVIKVIFSKLTKELTKTNESEAEE